MEMEPGKLFIGGISWDTSEERLREYFQTFGEIVEAVIMRDRTTGRARGFGFVIFANANVAEKVVRERHVIDGRTVEAKKAVPREDHQNFNRNNGSIPGSLSPALTKKIFVGGLASTVTETDFKQYFDQFGHITDVVVMYDHNTQRPRGFGFVTYDSEEAVDKVLLKTFHELNGKMVEVKRAVPKELSLGPTRSQPTGGGFNGYGGLNRANSFLSAYGSSSPIRMEGRFSPMTVGRRGYLPHSPSSYDSSLGLNFGPGPDSVLSYGRGMNSSYNSGITNRFGSGPVGYDVRGVTGNGPLANNTNQSQWSVDAGLNYGSNSMSSNASFGLGGRNIGSFGSFGNIGEIWGSAAISGRGRGNAIRYGIGDDSFGGKANEYGRKNGGFVSSYAVENNNRNEGYGTLYGGESFYADHGWHSSSLELEGPFRYGRGANGVMMPNDSIGYIEGYGVNAKTNTGIAA